MHHFVFMASLLMPLATLTPCDQATAPIACEVTDGDPLVNTYCPLANGLQGWCVDGLCRQQCGQDAENRCLLGGVQWVQHFTPGGACYCTAQ